MSRSAKVMPGAVCATADGCPEIERHTSTSSAERMIDGIESP